MFEEFLQHATWYGDQKKADAILTANPSIAKENIHVAAALGDAGEVEKLLAKDSSLANATALPHATTPLVYLCFSVYLRSQPERSGDFLKTAKLLLEAGADPNAGFQSTGQYPDFESALYGAAGVAHHAALTKLLLQHGANPNDEEAAYHCPETHENGALKAMVESGRMTQIYLVMMLVRKHDWHDYDGVKYLLEKGADPNGDAGRGWYPLHHAIHRDNAIETIKLLMDHGADPTVIKDGMTAIARAARWGRADVLRLFKEFGFDISLEGTDGLLAACALNDKEKLEQIKHEHPELTTQLYGLAGYWLGWFCGTGNTEGVRNLLDLGVDVNAFFHGDGYFEIPMGSLPIHIAAWRARHDIVKLLIDRGARIDTRDARQRTPLMLAVKACIDSYWMERRSPDSVKYLLDAGADKNNIPLPTGYKEIDILLN